MPHPCRCRGQGCDRDSNCVLFYVAGDPVKLGLVAGLARPGGNATGVNSFAAELGAKQLGLLRELLPTAARIGLMVNPTNPNFEGVTKDVTAASSATGVQIDVVRASDSREIEAAFATLVRNRADALVVGADSFFTNRRLQVATLATRHAIPAVYVGREFVEAGGLMTYGTSLTEVYRQLGAKRRPHPQGRQAGRAAGRAVDQVRACHQPDHSKGAR